MIWNIFKGRIEFFQVECGMVRSKEEWPGIWTWDILFELTHWGLVMPDGDMYLDQHWFR